MIDFLPRFLGALPLLPSLVGATSGWKPSVSDAPGLSKFFRFGGISTCGSQPEQEKEAVK